MAPPEKKIELGVGDTYKIRLQGRGTAGYEWSYNVEGEEGIIEIARDIINPGNAYERLAIGQSIDEVFVIRGNHAGRATVHFVLRRPVEIGVPPLKEKDIEVIVIRK